jgi:hypothetical protein
VNFHTLDNLTVPPELIEKALAISESTEKPAPAVPWYRNTRLLAAAASVVLVVMVGVSVILFFGDRRPPVKEVVSHSPTVSDKTIAATDPATLPSETPAPQSASAPSEALSEGESATQKASQASEHEIAKPSESSATIPVTEAVKIPPSEAAPTEPHTLAPPERMTTAPVPTERATEQMSVQPTTPDIQPPTIPDDGEPGGIVPGAPGGSAISFSVSKQLLTGSGNAYCVLYETAGSRVDSEPILSAKHEAIPSISYGYAYFNYTPPAEWNLITGMYNLEVYNEDGVIIKQTLVFFDNE